MADHSVVARDKLCESKANWASVFSFDNASQKSLLRWRSGRFYFTMPTCFCFPECHQKEVKTFTGKKVFYLVSPFSSERKTDEGK